MAELWSRTLQPAQRSTALAFVIMISFGILYLPDSSLKGLENARGLFHITSFSIWVGTQFWVTFVAGLTMIKVLPRHMFGEVQSHLFRKYFLSGTVFSTVAFVTFLMQHPYRSWSNEEQIQGITLLIVCISTILNFILLEPMTVKYMLESHRYEKEHGKGEGAKITSEAEKNKALQEDKVYRGIRSSFFIWHGISSTANLISFAACGFRLWFLAKKISA